jgi:hypothetical protein
MNHSDTLQHCGQVNAQYQVQFAMLQYLVELDYSIVHKYSISFQQLALSFLLKDGSDRPCLVETRRRSSCPPRVGFKFPSCFGIPLSRGHPRLWYTPVQAPAICQGAQLGLPWHCIHLCQLLLWETMIYRFTKYSVLKVGSPAPRWRVSISRTATLLATPPARLVLIPHRYRERPRPRGRISDA